MRKKKKSGIFFFMPALFSAVIAQDIPPGGVSLLPDDAALKMNLSGTAHARKMTVPVEDMPFTQAVQVETFEEPALRWDTQLIIKIPASIDRDDVMLAVFYARGTESSLESGEVRSEFVVERDSDPWTKSVEYPVAVVNPWKHYFVPFACAEDYEADSAAVKFRCGYPPQILQIGGLQILNYRKTLSIDDLPRTSIDYTGREPDSPWRIEAEAMIDQYRKAEIRMAVNDSAGHPVEGAVIHIKMRKHAYKFGSAVDAATMMLKGSDTQLYNDIIEKYFNRVVMENDLKWPRWEDQSRRSTTMSALDFLRDAGIEIRGHTLVWPGWSNMPADLEQHKNDAEYLRQRVADHIEEEVTSLAGIPVNWDVINEPYWNHDLMDILGSDVMSDWFRLAHDADPQAVLYLNDNNIISAGGLDRTHQDHFCRTVEFLLDQGAPIQGLGTQCHFGENVTPPERIWEILDRLSVYGLEIQATEFDINTDDRALQADYTRDFMTAYFAHPSTIGILMWGFWAGKHWIPDAALWDRDWHIRPHGEIWKELVFHAWWTDETPVTDANGNASVCGFLGDYLAEITLGGRIIQTTFTHKRDGTTITVNGNAIDIMDGIDTDISSGGTGRDLRYHLFQNYPNPFNNSTTFIYSLGTPCHVTMGVYNLSGQLIDQPVDAFQHAGEYRISWNAAGFPSGIYFCRLQAGEFAETRKWILQK